MSEPGKYWDVKKFDVGRELANPDWVEWASENIKGLQIENKVLTATNEILSEAVSQSEIVLRIDGNADKADRLLKILAFVKQIEGELNGN